MKQEAILVCLLLMVVAVAVGSGNMNLEPVKVHVFGTVAPELEGGEKKELKKELKLKAKELADERKALKKKLKQKYQGKVETWPDEDRYRYLKLEEAAAYARYEYDYCGIRQDDVNDSLQDLKNSFVGEGFAREKEHVSLVESREEADLLIEVMGRRREDAPGGGKRNYLVFKIHPGSHLDRASLATIEPTRWYLNNYTSEMPFWMIMAQIDAGIRGWSAVGNAAAGAVNKFAEKNHEALTAHRK